MGGAFPGHCRCETQVIVLYVWLVCCENNSVWVTRCYIREKFLTTRHLGCLCSSFSELHVVSCCVAVDRLNRSRWSALEKWQGDGHFVGGADVPFCSFSPVHSSPFSGSFKIDRPMGMSLTRAEVVLFPRIRGQTGLCSGCCNFFYCS